MKKIQHDLSENKVTELLMTADEIAAADATAEALRAAQIASDDRAAEKAALLAHLGITEDQARLLLS